MDDLTVLTEQILQNPSSCSGVLVPMASRMLSPEFVELYMHSGTISPELEFVMGLVILKSRNALENLTLETMRFIFIEGLFFSNVYLDRFVKSREIPIHSSNLCWLRNQSHEEPKRILANLTSAVCNTRDLQVIVLFCQKVKSLSLTRSVISSLSLVAQTVSQVAAAILAIQGICCLNSGVSASVIDRALTDNPILSESICKETLLTCSLKVSERIFILNLSRLSSSVQSHLGILAQRSTISWKALIYYVLDHSDLDLFSWVIGLCFKESLDQRFLSRETKLFILIHTVSDAFPCFLPRPGFDKQRKNLDKPYPFEFDKAILNFFDTHPGVTKVMDAASVSLQSLRPFLRIIQSLLLSLVRFWNSSYHEPDIQEQRMVMTISLLRTLTNVHSLHFLSHQLGKNDSRVFWYVLGDL
jgi:hypothetical protein